MAAIQFAWGKESSSVINVARATRGPAGNYTCLECAETLVLRKGVQRIQHFAHIGKRKRGTEQRGGCSASAESAEHKAAKLLLQQHYQHVTAQRTCRGCGVPTGAVHLAPPSAATACTCTLEHTVGPYRVDAAFFSVDGTHKVAAEVTATHGQRDPERIQFLQSRGWTVVEVLASNVAEKLIGHASGAVVLTNILAAESEMCASCVQQKEAKEAEAQQAQRDRLDREKAIRAAWDAIKDLAEADRKGMDAEMPCARCTRPEPLWLLLAKSYRCVNCDIAVFSGESATLDKDGIIRASCPCGEPGNRKRSRPCASCLQWFHMCDMIGLTPRELREMNLLHGVSRGEMLSYPKVYFCNECSPDCPKCLRIALKGDVDRMGCCVLCK